MKESRVQRIKEHVLRNEHMRSSGYGRFHSDYEIAQAWDRLQKGLQTQKEIWICLTMNCLNPDLRVYFKTD